MAVVRDKRTIVLDEDVAEELGLKPGELRREEIYEERLGHKYPGLHDR